MNKMTTVAAKVLVFGGVLCATVAMAPDAHAAPRTHDGFYLQLDLGVGYLSSSSDEVLGTKIKYHGVTIPSAILLGGTIGPVVLGGGLWADYAPSPSATVESGGQSATVDLTDVSLTLYSIGMFADIYPNPHEGLHFQPFVGFGGLSASSQGRTSNNDPIGLVLALGAGYDFWVSSEWSIGVMGRFAYAPLKQSSGGSQSLGYTTIAPSLLATFTYH